MTGDDSEEGIDLFKKYQKEKSDEITVPNTVFIGGARKVLETLKNRGKKNWNSFISLGTENKRCI